jgi:hypothetical protein
MEKLKKIDHSLTERRGILSLLERLKKENITIGEMEEIGAKLQKAGRRALSPLVRRLWREKSGALISKYAYLLDFIDVEAWIDQLIHIALRRRDLEDEGKEALLAVLEGYGVDVSVPPLAGLLAQVGGPLSLTLPRLLNRGEEGVICFVEDLLFYDQEDRLAIIRELPTVPDPRVVSLLGLLTGIDDPDIDCAAAEALGKIRDPDAAAMLQDILSHPEETVRKQAEKSLLRLSFLGISAGPPSIAAPMLPYYAAHVTPFDGAGIQTLWLARRQVDGLLTALYLHIHETRGIIAAWGGNDLTVDEFTGQMAENCGDEGRVEISPDYALQLIRDAIFKSREYGVFLPPEFYVWRGAVFEAGELVPTPYAPQFEGYDLAALAVSPRLIASGAALLDEECFAGWFLATNRVYDFAEEWLALEKSAGGKGSARGTENILTRFCAELLVPQIELISSRLLLAADLLQRTGHPRDFVERILAAALSMTSACMPPHRHPFLKRFALESMETAREALEEGYDLRQHPGSGDDDWE